MGHQPLIQDNSFTTKLPLDVDESQFTPFSTIAPRPSDLCKVDNVYFGLKCRYVSAFSLRASNADHIYPKARAADQKLEEAPLSRSARP